MSRTKKNPIGQETVWHDKSKKTQLPEVERGIAIYVRVGKDNTMADARVKADVLREFLLKNGKPVKYEMIDRCSAFTMDKKSRSGLYDLMYRVIASQVSQVYVYSTDNISPVAFPLIKEMFAAFGTTIISVAQDSGRAAEKLSIYNDLSFFISNLMRIYGAEKAK